MTTPQNPPALPTVRLLPVSEQINAFLLARDLRPLSRPVRSRCLHGFMRASLSNGVGLDYLKCLCIAAMELVDAMERGQIPSLAKFGTPGCGPWFERHVN